MRSISRGEDFLQKDMQVLNAGNNNLSQIII